MSALTKHQKQATRKTRKYFEMSSNFVLSLDVTGGAVLHPRLGSAAGHDHVSANHIADRSQAANQRRPILDIRGTKGLYQADTIKQLMT